MIVSDRKDWLYTFIIRVRCVRGEDGSCVQPRAAARGGGIHPLQMRRRRIDEEEEEEEEEEENEEEEVRFTGNKYTLSEKEMRHEEQRGREELELEEEEEEGRRGGENHDDGSHTSAQGRWISHFVMRKETLITTRLGAEKTLAILVGCAEVLYQWKFTARNGAGAIILTSTREVSTQIYTLAKDLFKYHRQKLCILLGGANRHKEAEKLAKGVSVVIATPGRLLDHLNNTKGFVYKSLKERQTVAFTSSPVSKFEELSKLLFKRPPACLGVDDAKRKHIEKPGAAGTQAGVKSPGGGSDGLQPKSTSLRTLQGKPSQQPLPSKTSKGGTIHPSHGKAGQSDKDDLVVPPVLPFKKTQMADRYPKGGTNRGRPHWKHLKQILQAENYHLLPANEPTYVSMDSPPSLYPPKKYCDITGYEACYTDPRTKLRYANCEVLKTIRLLPEQFIQDYLALRNAAVVLK
ncbi:hypothetical protein CBR_g12196 [Chara braunii]|uniref:Helicase ATP-binding domain-containing protein n=1 Tax=Chara braunii TaxID=69332 RepID=A0A388KRR2_CHABU|nr:hypothetical protein CBR_g12196 [Chara braunii]|eukprot:GBG72623.1 hypothetical protein CBR_g12196 [Chara braunii]